MMYMYKLLFFNLMIISTLISISTMSWFTAWIGLEVNLMSFIPLMKQYQNKHSAESAIKYFIIQAMASSILLFSTCIYLNYINYKINLNFLSSIFINSALLLKMGAVPFHFWLPEICMGINWNLILILLTWQKISPMILLFYSMYSINFISIIILLSSLISSLQGMNQTHISKIMAYSSINHMSWMISTLMNSITIWLYYFCIYSIINSSIMIIFYQNKIFQLNQLSKILSLNKKLKLFFMMNFFSLAGLPPFLGFFPKWITINFMIKTNLITLSFFLITFTLISLYFYMRITFPTVSLTTEKSLIKTFNKFQIFNFLLNFISLMGILMCMILKSFY
uniref:NADH-ubiquinone oxidoreductase chain 2 n=1 Tax=Kyklioacalles sp. BMNH 1043787 TaxID=2834675 RepID=A0A8F4WBY8_9CUCU|nr:NADH dehydrogenase subunit 2 [Kyklioacalles sp. BMNH 1043787]